MAKSRISPCAKCECIERYKNGTCKQCHRVVARLSYRKKALMHAHDRTLISRLGFADPDKKEPLHDLACRYLALPVNARRLASMVFAGQLKETEACIEAVCHSDMVKNTLTGHNGQRNPHPARGSNV